MESSVNFTESSESKGLLGSRDHLQNFDFFNQDLDDIPHPDGSPRESKSLTSITVPDSLPTQLGSFKSKSSNDKFKNASPKLLNSNIFPPLPGERHEISVSTAEIPMPDQSENHSFHSVEPTVTNLSPSLNKSENVDYKKDKYENTFTPVQTESDLMEGTTHEAKKFLDDCKYSPSKVDSDEENQDSITAKPKVLGKEQAKKRLMAFSLSKQPTVVKRQSKVMTPAKTSKEKPPNPNKSSGVQEQFRATISAIEEEKKKMMQNMPNYLLLEMSDLAKSNHPIITSSLQLLEKHKSENPDNSTKDRSSKDEGVSNKSSTSYKSKDNKRSSRRSRSRSKRRSRSRSRSRNKRRSPRRRSRSKSQSRRTREEKNKSDRKDSNHSSKIKELPEDWKSFTAAGYIVADLEFSQLKNRQEDPHRHRDEHRRRSRSPNDRDFKPVYNYLKKSSKIMVPLQAKPSDSGTDIPVLFPEKIVKYTRTKPTIIWSENPSRATEFYMSRQMLLENCDQATATILEFITDNKSKIQGDTDNLSEAKPPKTRSWYPRKNYLSPTVGLDSIEESQAEVPHSHKIQPQSTEEIRDLSPKKDETNKKEKTVQKAESSKEITESKEESKADKEKPDEEKKRTREKRISLVNDSYLSDEEAEKAKIKEMVVGDVKVQLDLGLNCVKVRSKWDSDYDGDSSDKETAVLKVEDMEIATPEEQPVASPSIVKDKPKTDDSSGTAPRPKVVESAERKVSEVVPTSNLPKTETQDPSTEAPTGNLVSEYEEFLKMVSFDFNEGQDAQSQDKSAEVAPSECKTEKPKGNKAEKVAEESRKFEVTDWDQESDREETVRSKKVEVNKTNSCDEFLLLNEEKYDTKKKKGKNSVQTKKLVDKSKTKKSKPTKKSSKAKKKKYESSSSDTSSDSYDSESDSDSVESKSTKKKKKKKNAKVKKKSKKDSSSESESESDSDRSRSKKKKAKKKKIGKKKKHLGSDIDEEMQTALLKQLDFKKQLIIKKIEEIDSISERTGKKKELENRQKKKEKENLEESELLERFIKTGKKPKVEKEKRKSKGLVKKKILGKNKESTRKKSSSESESEESDEKAKKKKSKKDGKKKHESSDSSNSEEKTVKSSKSKVKLDRLADIKNLKSISKAEKLLKKAKERKSYSSSESDSDDDDSSQERKKIKKKAKKGKEDEDSTDKDEESKRQSKENFIFDDAEYKSCDSQVGWGSRKISWKKSARKTVPSGKEVGDWEASSSIEESEHESKSRESSWDDEAPPKTEVAKGVDKEEVLPVDEKPTVATAEKEVSDKEEMNVPETTIHPTSDTLKTSLSNFSFNENSFCSFGQELSRDFFLTERSFSNSTTTNANYDDSKSFSVESRPFQSVSNSGEIKKPAESELYSPGYSDSELSDVDSSCKIESNTNSNACSATKEDVYDPLNCDSEASVENTEIELSSIPLPCVADILLPGETRNVDSSVASPKKQAIKSPLSIELKVEEGKTQPEDLNLTPLPKSTFTASDFTPISLPLSTPISSFNEVQKTTPKKPVINMKSQQKLKSKAASVFQDESDDETAEVLDKNKINETAQLEIDKSKIVESIDVNRFKEIESKGSAEEKEKDEKKGKRESEGNREGSRGRSSERGRRRRRSSSRDRRDSKSSSSKASSPSWRKRSRTPDSKYVIASKEKKEIKSDSFEIEPLKSSIDSKELEETIQPIPVLTGLMSSCDRGSWNRSHMPGYTCNEFSESTGAIVDHAESFDIYPSEDSKFQGRQYEKDYSNSHEETTTEKLPYREERSKKDRRKSRSRSLSPRKKRRSKSLERPRNRSPRRRSPSPKRRDKSPYSPRRRSPKRKSSPRRYRSSRSPDRRRKSRSRSPRKRRRSPLRRSRSVSPRKHRSPKRRADSPRRRDSPLRTFSPRESTSPRKDLHFSQHSSNLQNRIPVIGVPAKDVDMEMSPSAIQSPRFDSPMAFPRAAIPGSDLSNSYYNSEHADEFDVPSYSEEVSVNNLITVKNHDLEKPNSPERLSLDQRIELELGVPLSSSSQAQNEQYPISNQVCQEFQEINPNHFQNSYNCDTTTANNDSFYQNQTMPISADFNGQYFNGHQQPPPNYGPFHQYPPPNPTPVQSSVLQVGNIVEVVPTLQQPPPPPPPLPAKPHQIMQVGNVLQVVPSPKVPLGPPGPTIPSHNFGPPSATSPMAPVKTQKATAVVAPSSIVPTPNPEVMNPLIKAIQIEREKRRKEKEKRKAEREARRKARQLRREAKLMSVNEKLKKSVVDEGLMLGQEVDDDELLDGLDIPSPPIPVEIITVSSPSALPPAGKGILITAGFMPKPPSEKKEVKFADGVLPGEGTSTSGGEDIASPPPKPKLPKEKRYKKKKTKVKKKVKVQIIRQIIHDEVEEDEDDLSPPPPPPGDPPPIFFARFPFAGDAQFPVYQTQTTTTTLTTVQYPSQSFQ